MSDLFKLYDEYRKKTHPEYICPRCSGILEYVIDLVYYCPKCDRMYHLIVNDLKKVSDIEVKEDEDCPSR